MMLDFTNQRNEQRTRRLIVDPHGISLLVFMTPLVGSDGNGLGPFHDHGIVIH
jgi:hypothetical protein